MAQREIKRSLVYASQEALCFPLGKTFYHNCLVLVQPWKMPDVTEKMLTWTQNIISTNESSTQIRLTQYFELQ